MDKAVDLENANKIKKYVQFSDNFLIAIAFTVKFSLL